MQKIKKNILIFIFICVLFGIFAGFALADRVLEVSYPVIPGINVIHPTTIKTQLTEYIKYVFNFALMISGLIAFGALIYGGVRYVTSAGSSGALKEGKDQIIAGALGLVVLLASYLILTTINPQIVILAPNVPVSWGIVIFKHSGCADSDEKKEITKDAPDLGSFNDGVASMEFRATQGSLDANIYPDTDYRGIPRLFPSGPPGACVPVGGSVKSIKFTWKLPGVYLVNTNGQEKFLPASTATLEGDFNDRVKDVKFNNGSGVDFGAILHENQAWKGSCEVFRSNASNIAFGSRASSVTVFTQSSQNVGSGVTFYENDNFGGRNFFTYQSGNYPYIGDVANDNVYSLEIKGNYIAVLFDNRDYGGTCQVFTKSDANLHDDPMGRCGFCGPFGWGCGSCLSSFMIIPTR